MSIADASLSLWSTKEKELKENVELCQKRIEPFILQILDPAANWIPRVAEKFKSG